MSALTEEIRSRADKGQSPYDIIGDMGLTKTELIEALGDLPAPPSSMEEAVMLEGVSGPLFTKVTAEKNVVSVQLKEKWTVKVSGQGPMPRLTVDGPKRADFRLGDSKVFPSFSSHNPVQPNRDIDIWENDFLTLRNDLK